VEFVYDFTDLFVFLKNSLLPKFEENHLERCAGGTTFLLELLCQKEI